MHAVIIVIGIGWVVFWLGWLAAALTAKSSRGRFGQYTGARIAVGVVIYLVIRFGLFHGHVHTSSVTIDPVLSGVGLALWVAGLGLAIWARLYIGRNWGMPMTRRENPDLVTTGPYRFVRHPIYTGIIAALVGTALATSLYVLIVVALITAYFIFSATREEKFLGQEFPDSYPAYKARTKMLVPFVF